MFDPIELLIDATVERVLEAYDRQYPGQETVFREILETEGRAALATISRSDALYHNVHHTAIVTVVGQTILRGKAANGETVPSRDWLHFVLSCLLHDIGTVAGICRDDRNGVQATGLGNGDTVAPPRGSTDAWLSPYHVDRGKLYARERFSGHETVDPELLASHIERTRFPVPKGIDHQSTSDLPGLMRAADLIGQLADPSRDQRLPALFYEFQEVGLNEKLGFSTPGDLRDDFPRFFRKAVAAYIGKALIHLQATEDGRRWVSRLSNQAQLAELVEGLLSEARGTADSQLPD